MMKKKRDHGDKHPVGRIQYNIVEYVYYIALDELDAGTSVARRMR